MLEPTIKSGKLYISKRLKKITLYFLSSCSIRYCILTSGYWLLPGLRGARLESVEYGIVGRWVLPVPGVSQTCASQTYTVPKVIDFPRYNMKWMGGNEILRGIVHVVPRFPLHFMLYRGNFDFLSTAYVKYSGTRFGLFIRVIAAGTVVAN